MRSQKGRWTRRSLEISSDSSHSAILHLRGFPGVPNCTSQEEHSSLHQHMYFGCWFTVLTKRAYCWGDIPRGAKGATHSPVRMEWAALTDCYIFFVCKQLQWFFFLRGQDVCRHYFYPWKMSLREHENYILQWLQASSLHFFTLCILTFSLNIIP